MQNEYEENYTEYDVNDYYMIPHASVCMDTCEHTEYDVNDYYMIPHASVCCVNMCF